MEQHCLPPNSLKEDPCGKGNGHTTSTQNPKPGSLQVQDEVCPEPQTPKLMIRQRHGRLFDELDLSSLDSWAAELVDKAHQLFAKYHNVFSLDPAELGCTHSTKHTIKVTDDTAFKE